MISKEVEIENNIKELLVSKNIYLSNIVYTTCYGCILSLSTFNRACLDDLLVEIGYNTMCDKTGFELFEENNTVILKGIAIYKFHNKLGK